ncbi:MAG: hypothetical protein RBG13Loki_3496 [Promethearchaeota archaeon CR_4]|nr:MAG: hypothetical protein RBG13Loki_3496 [Candidatus Lokiarchaeota archaeon CR_4]
MSTLMILQDGSEFGDPFTILIMLFILSSCLCAPIARTMQDRRQRRANQLAQQAHQQIAYGAAAPNTIPANIPIPDDKNLRLWEETLLNAQVQDRQVKLDAISKLGRLGTKNTFDMLSEYAEMDRDPEILAAIENALAQIENRMQNNRISS